MYSVLVFLLVLWLACRALGVNFIPAPVKKAGAKVKSKKLHLPAIKAGKINITPLIKWVVVLVVAWFVLNNLSAILTAVLAAIGIHVSVWVMTRNGRSQVSGFSRFLFLFISFYNWYYHVFLIKDFF